MAIVRVTPEAQYVLHLSELTHRGADIHAGMGKRAAYRRNRRNRKRRGIAPTGSGTGPGTKAGCSRALTLEWIM